MKKISQREARRLQKRVRELQIIQGKQFDSWSREFPGIHLGSVTMTTEGSRGEVRKIETARKLGFVVVVATDGDQVRFYAGAKP